MINENIIREIFKIIKKVLVYLIEIINMVEDFLINIVKLKNQDCKMETSTQTKNKEGTQN